MKPTGGRDNSSLNLGHVATCLHIEPFHTASQKVAEILHCTISGDITVSQNIFDIEQNIYVALFLSPCYKQ